MVDVGEWKLAWKLRLLEVSRRKIGQWIIFFTGMDSFELFVRMD